MKENFLFLLIEQFLLFSKEYFDTVILNLKN